MPFEIEGEIVRKAEISNFGKHRLLRERREGERVWGKKERTCEKDVWRLKVSMDDGRGERVKEVQSLHHLRREGEGKLGVSI